MISKTVQLPNTESAIALAGNREDNLQLLSRHTGAKLVLRGQDLLVSGQEKAVERSIQIVRSLKPYWIERSTAFS